jgi:hypothetical protein
MTSEPASFLLSPSRHTVLVHDHGMTHEQAFDTLAMEMTTPEALALVQGFQETPAGRRVLALLRDWWHADGLPVPWDNLLELK